jgi:hypothetical protein
MGNLADLILGPDDFPPRRGGLVSKMKEGRGSLCPRGLGLLRFDGQPEGGGLWVHGLEKGV